MRDGALQVFIRYYKDGQDLFQCFSFFIGYGIVGARQSGVGVEQTWSAFV